MNPAEWLLRTAQMIPHHLALVQGETVVADYAEFAERAGRFASALLRDGVEPGERVAIFAKNCTAYLEALYGIWQAGAVVVPINAKLHGREAAWIIADSGAHYCCVTADLLPDVQAHVPDNLNLIQLDGPEGASWLALHEALEPLAPYPTRPDDLIWLFYTSGTTGKPKGVMLTAGNLTLMTLSYVSDVDRVDPSDAILYAAPMSHGAGLYNFVHVIHGARHVVPDSGGFDAGEVLDLAARLRNVSMFAAPTMVRRLVDAARTRDNPGDGIKTIVYGGGPMYLADIIEAVDVMGPRFVQIYGQGECPMAITSLRREMVADRDHPDWRRRLVSVGTAQSTIRIRIEKSDGSTASPCETGEILVQGALVMAGYWNNPQATAQAIRDGWLWTGDMGALDAQGYLTLYDRSKDVIISGGTNIYPREVEEALLLHPDVEEVSVIGHPDPEWGEEVVAVLVVRSGAQVTAKAMDDHCLSQIARFKRPKRYVFAAELPKNNYGKVVKTILREHLLKDTR